MSKSSPMMEQYRAVKQQHPDKLVMFQVGDFYEFFFEDARIAAREVDIVLTTRDGGSANPIPLAGVPIHAAENYLNRLLGRGYKVVVCDQVENAAQARGLVRREITRILTPGTITDPEMLEEGRNNYLVAVVGNGSSSFALAAVDVSTGHFRITEQKGEGAWEGITDELYRLQPSELLCSSSELMERCRKHFAMLREFPVELLPAVPTPEESKALIKSHWNDDPFSAFNLDSYPLAASAAAAVLTYLEFLHQVPRGETHFRRLDLYFPGRGMIIDGITSRNLELVQSLREGGKRGSLLGLIDNCMTGMGRRLLRQWVEEPLIVKQDIEKRQDAVEELLHKPLLRKSIRSELREIFDLERFCGRLSYERVNARDLVALRKTLARIEALKKKLFSSEAEVVKEIMRKLPPLDFLVELLERALVEDPPLSLKEGGLFKSGYNEEVDRLNTLSADGSNLLLEFEKRERERTGIKSLRVGYNRNFGYYIEATRANLDLVPPEYQRRQTLVNAERFTTNELYTMEEQITGARDNLAALEHALFEKLRTEISSKTALLLDTAQELATLDCLQALAETAEINDYCRPRFTHNYTLKIRQARHPVVEQLAGEQFVPNDIVMDRKHHLLVVTGPNMAGKSTYIRSCALISVMGQMGGFVPAGEAELPILDRLFARVGASDDLSRGQSTFMVEMQETASILKEATPACLIILDEIGRGTSTYDGMSIARAVLEYLSRRVGAKTLFSTHYHELTNLEGDLPGVRNYTMAVKERGKQVIFLRQVVPGKADKSYGINVARLAGMPLEVLIRAEAILTELELAAASAGEQQLSLLPMVTKPAPDYAPQLEVVEQLLEIDLNRTTPREALQKMFDLQEKLLQLEREPENRELNR